MNKIEMISVIRALVKEELNNVLRSKQLRPILLNVIKEEVRKEVDNLLTEMESNQAETTDAKLVTLVESGQLPPKNIVEKEQKIREIKFASDKKLNNILAETAIAMRRGEIVPPSALGTSPMSMYASMMQQEMKSSVDVPSNSQLTGKSVISMLPEKTVEGAPLVVNPNTLPDHLTKALTRNYKPLMKKIKEKK